ncbi:hypothetical protein FR483_n424L [Paramecium bursaria Chlorella virus FR483]|uniref:Uncharacterized protein n424L n=1 Tax=Paramecium bursaria Chlorella virus FR483 TaxID=399781 RepID=A7J7C8_PBCVF|nr:hypothetical protein FR483_n424L [Paramecium bursaria Chlorella virus FR483]ABT15709.1 hypothetical protein FR483_n424L [Paramecium bursaria Chlorella virus FR483]
MILDYAFADGQRAYEVNVLRCELKNALLVGSELWNLPELYVKVVRAHDLLNLWYNLLQAGSRCSRLHNAKLLQRTYDTIAIF